MKTGQGKAGTGSEGKKPTSGPIFVQFDPRKMKPADIARAMNLIREAALKESSKK